MSNVSKCFSCARKNDYDPKFGYFGCNLSGQECKGYSMFEPKAKQKPTNADRIRAMSDEELATWLNCMQSNAYHCGEFGRTNAAYPYDNKAWLEWLKQGAEE